MIHGTKRHVAEVTLLAETRRIARELRPLLEEPPEQDALVDAVAELLACFPVYRSYLPEGRDHLDQAFALARQHRPDLAGVFDAVAPVLGDGAAGASQRFQQTSGMVMAKGVEDCAFYRWSRLTSLNEVGGDPSVFAVDPVAFHDAMADPAGRAPARDDRGVHPRHQAGRGRPGPDRRAGRGPRRLGATRSTGCSSSHRCPTPASATCCGRPSSAPGPTTRRCATGSTRTPRRRCARPATAPPGPRPTRRTSGPSTPRSTPPSTTSGSAACSTRCCWPSATPAGATRCRPSCSASPSRASRTSTRAPSCGRTAWSTPTTVGRSTSRPAPGMVAEERPGHPKLRPGPRGAPAPTRPPRALHVVRRPCPRQARRPATSLAFDRGGAVTVVTRLPHGLAARGGWGDTTLALPAGRWRDLLTERWSPATAASRSRTLLATGPGRAARGAAGAAAPARTVRGLGTTRPSGCGWSSTVTAAGSSTWCAGRATGGAPPARCRPGRARTTATTATSSTTTRTPCPTPAHAASTGPSTARSRTFDADALPVVRRRLARPAARRRDDLRAARRHVHPRRHARRRDRPARPPRRDRRRVRRADAGQRLQRRARLGLRRRALVRGPRAVRRPGRLPALRRRLPRPRPRRDPGRRPQPPRTVGQLPADVRPLPGRGRHPLGRPGQPRPGRLARGAPADPGLGPRLVHRLPRRRAAARRRPRARRRVRDRTCSRRWPPRSPRPRPTSASRCS